MSKPIVINSVCKYVPSEHPAAVLLRRLCDLKQIQIESWPALLDHNRTYLCAIGESVLLFRTSGPRGPIFDIADALGLTLPASPVGVVTVGSANPWPVGYIVVEGENALLAIHLFPPPYPMGSAL